MSRLACVRILHGRVTGSSRPTVRKWHETVQPDCLTMSVPWGLSGLDRRGSKRRILTQGGLQRIPEGVNSTRPCAVRLEQKSCFGIPACGPWLTRRAQPVRAADEPYAKPPTPRNRARWTFRLPSAPLPRCNRQAISLRSHDLFPLYRNDSLLSWRGRMILISPLRLGRFGD